jgi:glutamine cyclotransferase
VAALAVLGGVVAVALVRNDSTPEPEEGPSVPLLLDLEVVAIHPHDPNAYTQGLEMQGDQLLESTGLRGRSTMRRVDPRSGEVLVGVDLDPSLFGEGATVVGDEVWQLTWTSETLITRRLDDLTETGRITYEGEGWGLCAEADRLIMSNGSNRLTFRDTSTFDPVGSVDVVDRGVPVRFLNELECVDGLVWANVYQTTDLVVIDPSDGQVAATVDLSELVPDGFQGDRDNVANGVAHDPATGRFWITGKRWPVLYEVEIDTQELSSNFDG